MYSLAGIVVISPVVIVLEQPLEVLVVRDLTPGDRETGHELRQEGVLGTKDQLVGERRIHARVVLVRDDDGRRVVRVEAPVARSNGELLAVIVEAREAARIVDEDDVRQTRTDSGFVRLMLPSDMTSGNCEKLPRISVLRSSPRA